MTQSSGLEEGLQACRGGEERKEEEEEQVYRDLR